MSTSTAQTLYSREVLRLAMSLPHDDRIDEPFVSATRRSPVCGSQISVDAVLSDGRIAAIALRARACALGQASAAILRKTAIGLSPKQIEAVEQQLRSALTGVGEMPAEFEVLAYARDYPARHGAILLPIEALLGALGGNAG